MSLGSISRPIRLSDARFVGDLMSLFKRQGIESGDPGGLASFESCFASKDNFRSQLFTLCTAISHMSEEDLSGEQLLVLIARGLGVPEAADGGAELPESLRTAFLAGYNAWSNRSLGEPAPWPPSREPAGNEPIPFPQRAEGGAEAAATERRAPDMHAPVMRTVQEALLMARKQSPFELPARSAPSPAVNVEDLTITELTRLLEDIERRMSRIKPQFHALNALVHPPDETLERPAWMHEAGEAPASKADAAAQPGPSLVLPAATGLPSPPEPAGLLAAPAALPVEVARAGHEEDPFLVRHTYLKAGRRLPPDTIVPIPLATPPPAPGEHPRAELAAKPSDILMALVDSRPERFRAKMELAVGVIAALMLVASPMAGFVAYRLLHPTYVIEYQDVNPAFQPNAVTLAPTPSENSEPPAASPASSPVAKVTKPKANAAASGSKATRDGRNPQTSKRTPPAAASRAWPPPPGK
jgi:hypothetical protein